MSDREDEIDLLALFRILWSHRLVVVSSTLLCGLIAVYLALTATPIYRAEAVITQVTDGQMGGTASLVGQLGGLASLAGMNVGASGGSMQEAMAILNSRHLIEEFIKRNQLVPELFPKAQQQPTLWSAVEKFQGTVVDVREDKRSGTTTLSMKWTDPAVTADWANRFVVLANDLIRSRAMDNSKRSIDYLNEQLAKTDVIEVRRVMYNLIEQETKTLMLANARAEYAFSIVDPAVPPEMRISPRRTVMVLIGLILGGVIGTVVAFVAHMLKSPKRTAQNA